MIKVGIVGGAGYTAGELIRILVNHPDVELVFINSSSNAGNLITDVHSGLLGDIYMTFTDKLPLADVDVIFLCMGHGVSKTFMAENVIPEHLKVIDLSHDFRLKAAGNEFVYGLPELNREAIKTCRFLANPGCFATAIQLALLPLASNLLLNTEVHVNAITGSTGAGQKPTETSHFSWRSGNVSVYKAFGHQHLGEIKESLTQLQSSFSDEVNFIPVRGNFPRGILAMCYIDCALNEDEVRRIFNEYYQGHPFVFMTDKNPDIKQVINTNKAVISVEKHGNKVLVLSCIDNLLKGASGQAVQNMNLMFDLEERTGLGLKAVSF